MQRDEFLPLRVIRQELAAGRSDDAAPVPGRAAEAAATAPAPGVRASASARPPARSTRSTTCSRRPRPRPSSCKELEEYGVVKGELRGGVRYFDETEREIIAAVAELARYGVGGRNLRVFRSSADREANLLQQILAPRCAPATPSAARRPSTRSRTSPPSPPISSTCC